MNRHTLYTVALVLIILATACGGETTPESPDPQPAEDTILFNLDGTVYTVDVCLLVFNDKGENLLDLSTEGHIRYNGITAEYRGETYPINTGGSSYPIPSAETNILKIPFQGLRVGDYHEYFHAEPKVALRFGPFLSNLLSGGYHDEKIIIDWGDGEMTEVRFDFLVADKESGSVSPMSVVVVRDGVEIESTLNGRLWIDGELVSDDSLVGKIVK